MRFALVTGQENTTWDTLRSLWSAADRVELWESAWVGDHFNPFLSDPTGPCLEGWVTLTALSQTTRRLRAGILVSGMPHRHPAVLAKMAAALDVVSAGRLLLGLGAAWNDVELGAFGIELGSLRTRMDRFEEGVEVVARLLTERSSSFTGQHYRLVEARCEPKALQRPRPPITIGGTGERRTVPVVARWADHWDLGFAAPADVPHKLEVLAERCAEIGRDPKEITISAVVRTAEGDRRRDLGEVVDEIGAYEAAGCHLALVEALAADPGDAEAEIDRLTAACQGMAGATAGGGSPGPAMIPDRQIAE
jgi:F420-dependent oxidoreductase-like protein